MRVAREAAGQHLRREPERQQEPEPSVRRERQEQPEPAVLPEPKRGRGRKPEPHEGQASELGQEPKQGLQAAKEPERLPPSFRKGS